MLFPTRRQWSQWSLPNRLTAIGAWIGVLSLLIAVAMMIGPELRRRMAEPARSEAQERFVAGLVASVQELRQNRDCLDAIADYLRDPSAKRPVCVVTTDATMQLLSAEYRRAIDASYGEGKHLFQVLLKVRAAATMLGRLQTRADYRAWNTTYEMTLDDLSFISGFLAWYLACRAKPELQPADFDALAVSTTAFLFVPPSQVNRLKMRYFMHEGRPITDYQEYLGLID